MLLNHPWLKPLILPPSIAEEDEDAEARNESPSLIDSDIEDREVADWVIKAKEKRKNGTLGKSAQPALHAAPLDVVPSPSVEKLDGDVAALRITAGGT